MASVRTVIAADVGGTKVAAALVRCLWPPAVPPARTPVELLGRVQVPTDVSSPRACLESIQHALTEARRFGGAPDAVGIGLASLMDYENGVAVDSVHLPLVAVPVRELFGDWCGLPVAVDNDATAACLGEYVFGAGVGTRHMLMLTLGTGVGGGIVCDGQMYRGCGAAGELGHVLVDPEGPECPGKCPNRGCLEAYVSGSAMDAAAMAAAIADPSSALGRAHHAGALVDGRYLTAAARAGDPTAVGLVRAMGERLGLGLVSLVNAFNPELVVVGGSAAAAGEILLEPARHVVAGRALRPAREQVRVVIAALGPDAGLYGAAALALSAPACA
ncbi:MAG: ROK family protein [Thermoleophilia bacterium]